MSEHKLISDSLSGISFLSKFQGVSLSVIVFLRRYGLSSMWARIGPNWALVEIAQDRLVD